MTSEHPNRSIGRLPSCWKGDISEACHPNRSLPNSEWFLAGDAKRLGSLSQPWQHSPDFIARRSARASAA